MQKIERLPDTELEVMQAVWRSEVPVSTRQVLEKLQQRRAFHLSALQTLLGRLVGRGFLSTEKQGKNRLYRPLIGEEEYLAAENRSFLERLNQNSLRRFVASLYDSRSITDDDLQELRRFIEEKTSAGSEKTASAGRKG